MVEAEKTRNYPDLPELIDAKTVQDRFHMSRVMVYNLINNPACGIVQIGRRKFFHRDRFLKWLEDQTTANQKGA